jgi:predicted RNase H-like nuclease (RuvC/YqgF family)
MHPHPENEDLFEKTILFEKQILELKKSIERLKNENLEEISEFIKTLAEKDREIKKLNLKCKELEHQCGELEDDLQTTEGNFGPNRRYLFYEFGPIFTMKFRRYIPLSLFG